MFLSHRTVEPNWEACRSRCKWTVYCNYFAFWPDGGCLITGTDSQRVMAESYEVISGPIHCNASYRTAAPSVEAWASQTTLPNIGHSEVASVTAAPETMAHMAEIEIPIFGLDVGQLAANDQHLLEGRYAEAIAKTLALPVSEIKEGPDQNDLDAQVHLSPGVGGGCILTAWTPNEPVSSSDPSVLRSKLKTPALITNLKLATTQAQLPVSALPGAQIQVGEPQVGTKEHPLQALVEPPSFWSQWWPLLIALTFAVCIGGFLFVHYFANQLSDDDEKRGKRSSSSSLPNRSIRLRAQGRGVEDVELPLKEGFESGGSGLPPPPPSYSGAPSSFSTQGTGYTPQYSAVGGSGRYQGRY